MANLIVPGRTGIAAVRAEKKENHPMGGPPSKGTPKDKRLARNKPNAGKGTTPVTPAIPSMPATPTPQKQPPKKGGK